MRLVAVALQREALRIARPNSLPAEMAEEYRARARVRAEAADAARREEQRAEIAARRLASLTSRDLNR